MPPLLASLRSLPPIESQVMDPVAQFLNSIPGFQGSMQNMNRISMANIEKFGPDGVWWLPEFISQQEAMGWL